MNKRLNREKSLFWEGERSTAGGGGAEGRCFVGQEGVHAARGLCPLSEGRCGERREVAGGGSQGRPQGDGGLLLKRRRRVLSFPLKTQGKWEGLREVQRREGDQVNQKVPGVSLRFLD